MRVACEAGHVFELSEELVKRFEESKLEGIIASISWCPEMVAKPEYANLLLECGARVLWVADPPLDKSNRGRYLVKRKKDQQLDLFD